MDKETHTIQPITADREHYIVRVGGTLEVRDRVTHAVLQILKPPPEWGNDWIWTSVGFDGVRCVALDYVRFIRGAARPLASASEQPTPPTIMPDSADPTRGDGALPGDRTTRTPPANCAPRPERSAAARSHYLMFRTASQRTALTAR